MSKPVLFFDTKSLIFNINDAWEEWCSDKPHLHNTELFDPLFNMYVETVCGINLQQTFNHESFRLAFLQNKYNYFHYDGAAKALKYLQANFEIIILSNLYSDIHKNLAIAKSVLDFDIINNQYYNLIQSHDAWLNSINGVLITSDVVWIKQYHLHNGDSSVLFNPSGNLTHLTPLIQNNWPKCTYLNRWFQLFKYCERLIKL